MKTRILGVFLAIISIQFLYAQPGCPAITFVRSASEPGVGGGSNFRYILAKQPDGSFSELDYTVDLAKVQTTHQVNMLGKTANVQKNLIDCSGVGARTRHPVAARLNADILGTTQSSAPVAADLAGDGIGALLAFWDIFPDQLIVEKAASDYSVSSSTAYAVGPQPSGIVVADFNGDGKKDVAVLYYGPFTGNHGGGVSLLLGNGDGTLKPAVNYTLTGEFPQYALAYDFNGDGLPDLAVSSTQGNITVLFGNKNGTLTIGATYPGTASIGSMAIADVNGDGKADLLAFEGGIGIVVLYGNGDGTFKAGITIPFVGYLAAIATGDFNKDGITDIAVAAPMEGVSIFLGAGGGKFSTPLIYGTGTGYGINFFVEDFDGDGNLDLVFANGHPDALTPDVEGDGLNILFGNGDGTFAGPSVAPLDGDAFDQTQAPTTVVAADFNGDGKMDLATANGSGNSVSILLGQGAAGFNAPRSYSTGAVIPNSIAAGDFNGDGKADLLVTDGTSKMYFLLNNGDATFQAPVGYAVSGATPKYIVVGDFNGDKKLDAVVVNAGSNNISVLLGNGDGTFKSAVNYPAGTNPINAVVGDFNGDGKLDVAVANSGTYSTAGTNPGSISVFIGNGDGTFKAAVNYPAYSSPAYPAFLALGDVDGDKKVDLVVIGRQSTGPNPVTVLLGNGDGTFKPAFLGAFTGFGPSGLALADFSGDGNLDLIVPHCCGATNLTFMVGTGNGGFGSQTETTISVGGFFSVAVADFNGDGKPDVAATSGGSPNIVSTFLNATPAKQGVLAITSAAGAPLKLPPVAPFSIVTAKGTDLATGILVNASATPPTTMLGTTVTVTDSSGATLPAQLFYVSPGQVNFLIPKGTVSGNASITITSGDGFVSAGTVAIAPIAPSLFTLNANALAAAYVQRVHLDGTQSIENLYAVDGAGNVTFPPIDLGPSTDQVYLNVYGTGISGSPQSAVTVLVGNANAQVFYAGPSSYPGEDQVAILLPRSLVGAGTVNLVLTASGNVANTTTLGIK